MSAWPLREWPSGENYPAFDGGESGDEEVGNDDDGHLTRNSNPTI